MIEVSLQIETPSGKQDFAITGESLTIGRGDAAQLKLDDPALSRIHASLHRQGDKVWIQDAGSINGTFINDESAAPSGRALKDGDRIRLGAETTIKVRIKSPGAEKPDGRESLEGVGQAPIVVAVIAVILFLGLATAVGLNLRRGRRAEQVQRDAQIAAIQDPSPAQGLTPDPAPIVVAAPPDAGIIGPRLYREMNEAQKLDFIDARARQITRMMGNREFAFDRESLGYVKKYVDGYAQRIGTGSTRLWGEDLRLLFKRAQGYAPMIIREFDKAGVGPVVGLYIPVIESEYQTCLQSPVGAKGMFQFMAETARGYGVDPDDRCDVNQMARAAALYMKDRVKEFGPDAQSVALGIAGYNRSPDSIRRDLAQVVDSLNDERSFWTLISRREELDRFFQNENVKYVPKFFAAAIVGETPWAFGLEMKPLSTYQ